MSTRKSFSCIHQIYFTETPQTEKSIPPPIQTVKGINSNLKVWTLGETWEFLRKEYGSNVASAFSAIKPFAFKADLARYCILNHFGGLYLDIGISSLKPFEILGNEMVLFRDLNGPTSSWKVSNGLFYTTPQSKILEEAIEICLANIASRYYGLDAHFPTGPSVLGRATARFGPETNILFGDVFWSKYRRTKFVLPSDGVVARGKVGGKGLGGISNIPGGNNYNLMWNERTVY